MKDCIFCRIVAGQIPSEIVHDDDQALAFQDINPQAPIHLLIIPKRHIDRLSSVTDQEQALAGYLLHLASRLAREKGIADEGFRLVVNSGPKAGQTVFHLHIHLMGGRMFDWPPG